MIDYFLSLFREDLETCNEHDHFYDGLSMTNKYLGFENDSDKKVLYEVRYTFQSPVSPFWIVMYPMSVLATNRALDTVISRKIWSKRFMVQDIRDIYSLGRFKALYAAIIPGIFMFTVDSANLYCQEFISSYKGEFDDDKEFVSEMTIESGG